MSSDSRNGSRSSASSLAILAAGLLVAAATLLASGCGLSETAATAAVGGTSEAEQARQAKATEDRVKQQVDAAMREDAQRRAAAESAAAQ